MVDVAARAGVSLKTVSRVVNQEPGVTEETTARVQSAIEALEFRRHELASNLRRGRSTSSLGLVIMDVANPFFAVLTRAVEEVASQHGFLVLTASSDENVERERNLALALCARRVDGLVLVPTWADHGYLEPEIKAGTPVVFVDRPGKGVRGDAVLVDNAGGTKAAVEHLAAHGHRNIAFMGDNPAIYTAQERLRGYKRGLSSAGLRFEGRLVEMGPHSSDTVRAALERLRRGRAPATALVTGNNRITVMVLRALAAMRWRPALVGFDDLELADLVHPGVTVIAQDAAEIGRLATELVFTRLGGDRRPAQRIILPTKLLPRGSGEIPPP